jgi:hypothetical protein
VVLSLAAACLAKVLIHSKVKQKYRQRRPEKIYLSACSAVQRKFGSNQVTIVLSADKDAVMFDEREIRFTKWDRHRFAQGVVVFAL